MPGMYSKYHRSFLERFNESNNESDIINNEKQFFAKNKMNYLFPIYTCIKVFIYFI